MAEPASAMTRLGPEDARRMRLALAEAARGRGAVEPNPMVGAAIFDGDRLVALGNHALYGGPHAEIEAISTAAASKEDLRGMTIYVTLEPCCHQGKTPPCTDAILRAGFARVVVATLDPFPLVSGGGVSRLRAAGVQVDQWSADSEIAAEAVALNRPFFKRVLTGRPYVIAKWAMSLDGRIALPSGDSRWISNGRSRALVHELRGRVDAVIVGIGTALADDPSLTARPPGPRVPIRVVVDPKAELPAASRLVRTARETPVRIYCAAEADRKRVDILAAGGCEVVPLDADVNGTISPDSILDHLGRTGATNVLVEGGSRLLGRFFDSAAIDEVQAFLAPALFGGNLAFAPIVGHSEPVMENVPRLESVRRFEIGDDTLIVGDVPSEWMRLLLRNLKESG